jgi:uncharacterized protein YdcH (DUF465 family)
MSGTTGSAERGATPVTPGRVLTSHRAIAVSGSAVYRKSVTTTTQGSKQAALEQLTAEHRRLDEQLRMLERRRALTPAEQVEITRLKKQKLLTKDRIARLS